MADFTPFARGYALAMLGGWIKASEFADEGGDTHGHALSDLAAETIESIQKDCEAFQALNPTLWAKLGPRQTKDHAAQFWLARQEGVYPPFPPLTAYFDDAGKIRTKLA